MNYEEIKKFMTEFPNTQLILKVDGGKLEDGGGTPIPPTPTNVKTVQVVEDENANGFWQKSVNDAGKPVLDICRDAAGRPVKQWLTGTLQVYTPDADVDGSIKFYEVYGYTFPAATYPNKYGNQKCYVKLGDVEFV